MKKRKKMVSFRVTADIDIRFEAMDRAADNASAKRFVRAWIKEALESECSYIPFYLMVDGELTRMEFCTRKSVIKLRPDKRKK